MRAVRCVEAAIRVIDAAAPRGEGVRVRVPYGRHAGGRDADAAAALLAATPELPRAPITHRFPLDAAREAFAVAADEKSGAIKVVLQP